MKSGYNIGLDLLKMVAIFSVIVIHLPVVDAEAKAKVLRCLPYGNACFALLAGWLMFGVIAAADEMSGFREWIRNRCRRLLVPYAVWTGIHLTLTFGLAVVSGTFSWPSVLDWYRYVFCGYCAVQLWFVISLFYAQMAIALLVVAWRSPMLFLALGVLAVYGASLVPIDSAFRNHVFMFGLVAVGFAARLFAENSAGKRLVSGIPAELAMISGGGGVVVLSYFLSFGHFWLLPVCAWCLAFGAAGVLLGNVGTSFGRLTMGIYLTHWFVIRVVVKPAMPALIQLFGNGCCTVVASALFVLAVCAALTRLLSRHKWLVG